MKPHSSNHFYRETRIENNQFSKRNMNISVILEQLENDFKVAVVIGINHSTQVAVEVNISIYCYSANVRIYL